MEKIYSDKKDTLAYLYFYDSPLRFSIMEGFFQQRDDVHFEREVKKMSDELEEYIYKNNFEGKDLMNHLDTLLFGFWKHKGLQISPIGLFAGGVKQLKYNDLVLLYSPVHYARITYKEEMSPKEYDFLLFTINLLQVRYWLASTALLD